MEKPDLFNEGSPLPKNQLRQLFIGCQISAIGGILIVALFGDKFFHSDNILYLRLDVASLVIGIIISSLLYRGQGRGHDLLSITAFLWLWAAIMALKTWFEGGLYSPVLLSFPVILIAAALFTRGAAFISIGGFLSATVVCMGANHVYGWFPPPDGMVIEGFPRVLVALALITLAGYISWIIGSLLKSSFSNLKRENKRVVQSQATIRQLANCDSLTSSLNRMGAESAYQALLNKVDFNNEYIITYFIDLDNFKSINDLFDHHAGDHDQ